MNEKQVINLKDFENSGFDRGAGATCPDTTPMKLAAAMRVQMCCSAGIAESSAIASQSP